MNNNELNNNVQPNVGNQILMGDTSNDLNQNNNLNQGINQPVNLSNQNVINDTNVNQNDNTDTIFSNTETPATFKIYHF